MYQVLVMVICLMSTPHADDPLNGLAAKQYIDNHANYNTIVKCYIDMYANENRD